ncbi:capsid protein [Capybara virus 23_cap1_803]|nr:capsid protein [Capybara virus 23_cap1_803]
MTAGSPMVVDDLEVAAATTSDGLARLEEQIEELRRVCSEVEWAMNKLQQELSRVPWIMSSISAIRRGLRTSSSKPCALPSSDGLTRSWGSTSTEPTASSPPMLSPLRCHSGTSGTMQDFREERVVGAITFGTTTVDTAAVEMARTIFRTMYYYFDGAAGADSRAPVKWQSFSLYNPTTSTIGVMLPLGDMLIEVASSSPLKVQNVSYIGSVTADADVDTTDNVQNITLEGYHYKGYGNHMLMKGGFIDGPGGYRTYNNDAAITTDRITGVMRKNPAATRPTGVNMDQLPVKPYQWQNVSRGAAVRLDSGCAKTDYINQYKKVTFQKFIDTLLAAGGNTSTSPITGESGVATENWSNQGKFSSFGLTRLINHTAASAQSLQCIYEVEQRIYANVVKVFKTPAVANTVVSTAVNIDQS